MGGQAAARALDVTDLQNMQSFVTFAEETFGPVDMIINNAGLMPLSPLASFKVAEWNQMIDVNIRGVLHGIAAVLPGMNVRASGHVINVASIGAHAVSRPPLCIARQNTRSGPSPTASGRRTKRSG